MPKSRVPDRKDRQERHARRRRVQAQQNQAQQTQRAQAEAAERRRRHLSWRRRKIMAWSLFGLAILVAVTHILEHLGAFQVMSPGLQDLFIGYPMAIALGVAAAIVAGTD